MIVVSGAGIISAIGNNLEEFREALYHAQSGIRTVKYLDTTHREVLVGEVQLSNRELADRLGIPLRADLSRTVLLGAMALREAVQHAQLSKTDVQHTALVSGTTVANMDCIERAYDGNNPPQIYGDCGRTTEEMAALVGDFAFLSTCSTACSSAANAFILEANAFPVSISTVSARCRLWIQGLVAPSMQHVLDLIWAKERHFLC